jgi:hypothetical protein
MAFFCDLRIPAAGGARRFGDCMADFQRRDFQALAPALVAVATGQTPKPRRAWLERVKSGSKDSDVAAMILWLLAFSPRPLVIQLGASDQSQADEMRLAALAIIRENRWLLKPITVLATAMVNERSGARADILPADTSGAAQGSRPSVVCLNEPTNGGKEPFASDLFDNLAKVPNALGIVATNAGTVGSWQERWRQQAIDAGPERWYFSRVTTPAPWLDPADLAEARVRNTPSRYARLWEGQWVSGEGDGLPNIDAAVKADLAELDGPEPGFRYVGGLDVGLRDRTGLVIVGKHVGYIDRRPVDRPKVYRSPIIEALIDCGEIEAARELPPYEDVAVPATGRLRVARVYSFSPPSGGHVQLETVERAILEAHNRFKLDVICADWSQAALLCQRLSAVRVPMEVTHPTGPNMNSMAVALHEALVERLIDIPPHEHLTRDMRTARMIETTGRGYKLDFPRTNEGHSDELSALALALHAAKRLGSYRSGPPTLDREIMSWPGPGSAIGRPGREGWQAGPARDLMEFDR